MASRVGAIIYSDRTPNGNRLISHAEPWGDMEASDILYSQLGLLPANHLTRERRAHIIVCGSAVLNNYADSDYYRDTYYKGIKEAYEAAQRSEGPEKGRSILSKKEETHPTEQAVKAKRFKVTPYIEAEAACLGALALKGLVSNQIEFKPSELNAVINELEAADAKIPTTLEENLMQLSCLQVERNNQSGKQLSYQFLHLTFQ